MSLTHSRSFLLSFLVLVFASLLGAQMDQGTITGTVHDSTGAVIPGAAVTLTNMDTGFKLTSQTDANGVYTFSPIKIGRYSVTVEAKGFSKKTQDNIAVAAAERTAADVTLQPGSLEQTVVVTEAPPALQTEQASTGTTVDSRSINDTPLNGRNYVFIAQLTAGVLPAEAGSRGEATGDFSANGQRAEQNNYILDGVDNNVDVVDFLNGASFVIKPPPDALQEFKVQTGDYSAEFGRAAGAVVNATVKSGTNSLHGNLWEYLRNDKLDARDFYINPAVTGIPEYRQNQFGFTLGGPIVHNKLFFFGDYEGDRVRVGQNYVETVPTTKMRNGDFSELLNTNLTGASQPITIYFPQSNGTKPQACNGQQNVLCATQIDKAAQNILNLYPLPNTNNGLLYNNYSVNETNHDDTNQFDVRIDYNISQSNQLFGRFSYAEEPRMRPSPLGDVLDGGGFLNGIETNSGRNFTFSETHTFSPSLINEFRFGFNWLHTGRDQFNITKDINSQLGLGGVPFGDLNGGLVPVSISGISGFGSPGFLVSNEFSDVYQLLDNVTKISGNHTLKGGVDFQHIRFTTLQPPWSHGFYVFDGTFTGIHGQSNTGYGVADFLTDNMSSAQISNIFNTDDQRWIRAGYLQDDWKTSTNLTVNLGLRYEYTQPVIETYGAQASFVPNGPGSGEYLIPKSRQAEGVQPGFASILAKDGIQVAYTDNPGLTQAQKTNFAPRVGLSYRFGDKLVTRAGYGLFYGALESIGYFPNLGENAPFQFTDNFPNGGCTTTTCTPNGITLEQGFNNVNGQNALANLDAFIATPTLRGIDQNAKTPYSMEWNWSWQYLISNNLSLNLGYVGATSRHLEVFVDPNQVPMLLSPTANPNATPPACTIGPANVAGNCPRPYPDFGGSNEITYQGNSSYNSLQATLERRFSNGINFLAAYTWSHSLDDAPSTLGANGTAGYRNHRDIGVRADWGNSEFDVRQRFAFNGGWVLPFGVGKPHLSQPGPVNWVLGGWELDGVFRTQTGDPFTIFPSYDPTNGTGSAFASFNPGVSPFSTGGKPAGTTPVTCATSVKNTTTWFNPCAFADPPDATGPGSYASYGSTARNWLHGPGYNRIDASIFKNFTISERQRVQFRTDVFNLFNTPAYDKPNSTLGGSTGSITGSRFSRIGLPDARAFQFALKYFF